MRGNTSATQILLSIKTESGGKEVCFGLRVTLHKTVLKACTFQNLADKGGSDKLKKMCAARSMTNGRRAASSLTVERAACARRLSPRAAFLSGESLEV
jgi:hypothetical protein